MIEMSQWPKCLRKKHDRNVPVKKSRSAVVVVKDSVRSLERDAGMGKLICHACRAGLRPKSPVPPQQTSLETSLMTIYGVVSSW